MERIEDKENKMEISGEPSPVSDPMSIESERPEEMNPNQILDEEEREIPMEQSRETPIARPTPLKTYVRTKRCPPGCVKKSRCSKKVRGGKRSKKAKKSKKNNSRKSRKSKK
jgi:hypothetical protein